MGSPNLHNRKGIFAFHAADYAEHGLCVFPVGGENGKTPLVRNWRKFGVNTWEKLPNKFANGNIGIQNGSGPNAVTVVDIDDASLLHEAIEEFGSTPLRIATPSGGYHLCYKFNGENRIIGYQNRKIDILGVGGFSIVPPSVRPGIGQYHFVEGDVTEFPNLPTMNKNLSEENSALDHSDEGDRNNTLFDYCRYHARKCDTEDELLQIAFNHNANVRPPLPTAEVQKTVHQVWHYKQTGKLILPGDNKMIVDLGILRLTYNPDALALLLTLIRNHGARRSPFVIDQEPVKEKLGWGSRRRVKNAIDVLVKTNYLIPLGSGGGKTGRAYLYQLHI